MVMIAQRPRFNTRQAARKAAIRAGMEAGSFEVKNKHQMAMLAKGMVGKRLTYRELVA